MLVDEVNNKNMELACEGAMDYKNNLLISSVR